jgi:hypothetical protein
MSNQNYVNHYIEILSGTMTDAILRNISLQANAKVTDETINEQATVIESLSSQVEEQRKTINELSSMKGEYESVRHQVDHVETFRNELIKERNEHQKTRDDYEKKIALLNKKLEKLKPTPARKVKEEETLIPELPAEPVEIPVEDNTIVKDGGSF